MVDRQKPLFSIRYEEEENEGDEFSDLPALLREIAEVVGRDAALDIAYVRGGRRCFFPARTSDDHWLVKAVGRESADALCKHFCVNHTKGVHVEVPLGPGTFYAQAKKRAVEMRAKGSSIATAARTLGVSTRAVEKWWSAADEIAKRLASAAPAVNTPPLFDRRRIEDDAEGGP